MASYSKTKHLVIGDPHAHPAVEQGGARGREAQLERR